MKMNKFCQLFTSAALLMGPFVAPRLAWAQTPSSQVEFIYTIAGNGTFGYGGDDGPATVAYLNTTQGTAVDNAGNVYIADAGNNRIRELAAGTGIITTVAGNGTAGYSGDGAAATSAELNAPYSVALDNAGNLYIADTNNNVIRKVTLTTRVITTVAGNGSGGYSGDGGPAINAVLNAPNGIALDSAGNIYIADTNNCVIRKITIATGSITTLAGNGSGGYYGDGGLAINASLNSPTSVSVDSTGNVYIADFYNNVIRKVSASSGVITTIAGNGYNANTGSGGYSGDGGPATSAELNLPQGVAVDAAGNLYIADTYNLVIREVTAGNGIINTTVGNGTGCIAWAGEGDGGPAASSELCDPLGISVDVAGNLYIADSYDYRIREVTFYSIPPTTPTAAPAFSVSPGVYANPQSLTITDATPGASFYLTLDGTTPTPASQSYFGPINISGTVTVNAIAIAPGYLQSPVVTAAYTITSPPTAVITTVAGNGILGISGAGGAATNAELARPQGIAGDNAGNLYIADFANVVWMVSAQTGIITIVAGNGDPGYSGDGGPAVNAQLFHPWDIVVDGAGNLYIADHKNYVIRKITAATGIITTYAGTGTEGNTGNGGPATAAELGRPTGLALDSAGNLYVTELDTRVVQMISASTGIITTVAGNGNAGYSGDGGLAINASLWAPCGVAVDSAGNLYIADSNNGRIRKVATGTGIITTVAGNGDPGSSGDGGPASNAEINPFDIKVDAAGNLYFTNFPNGTVREVMASSGLITTIAGSGFIGYSGDGGSATVAEMNTQGGIAFDAAGNLYIADFSNSRVRKVTFSGPASQTVTPVFSLAPGTYTGIQTVTITDSTPDAFIYYTTNGSTPTTNSTVYTNAISVSANETLEAIAAASGYTTSAVGFAAYVIQTAQTITFTPESIATYGSSYKLSATGGASGNPVTFAVTSGPANITNGSTLNFTGVGTVMVTASQAGNASYGAAPQVTRSITVNKAILTVAANSVSVPYGTTPVLTAAITGFVNGDTLSVVSGAPLLATTATSTILPGSYPISVGQGTLSATNYSFTLIGGTVTVTFTASAPAKGTLCNGAYNGTFSGNLTVSASQTCIFVGGGVSGNIQLSSGILNVNQSTVGGNLQVTGGGMFTVTSGSVIKGNLQIQSIPAGSATNLVCGSTVNGNLQFQGNGTAVLIGAAAPANCPGNIIDGNLTIQSNTAAATAVGNTVKGNLTVQSNTAATVIDNNKVSGNLQDQSNTAATQVFTNVVVGNLQCQSNTTISGGGNTAKSKQGQCSAY